MPPLAITSVAVGQQPDLVGTDTVARQFIGTPVAVACIVYPDHAFTRRIGVLAAQQPRAVGCELSVPVKMPAGYRGDPVRDLPARKVDDPYEGAGAAREHRGTTLHRVDGDPMPAPRQRDVHQPAAIDIDHAEEMTAPVIAATAEQSLPPGAGARHGHRRAEQQATQAQSDECPSVNRHRDC